MGQNSDIHNIFESYSNKVLVKEQTVLTDADWQLTDADWQNANARFQRMPEGTAKNELGAQLEKMKPSASAAPSTVAKPVEVDGTKPAASASPTPAPQSAPKNFTTGIYKNPAAPQPAGTPAPQPAAPTKTDPKAEYNKKLGRTPGDYDPDSFENVDLQMNSQNKALDKARAIKQGILAGNNAAPQPAAGGTPPPASALSAEKQKMAEMQAAMSAGDQEKANKLFDELGKIRTDNNLPNQPIDGLKQNPQPGDATSSTPDAPRNPGEPAYDDAAKKQGAKPSGSSGGSIVDYLAGKNQKFDKASRAKLAAQYNIQNYTGTAQQNTDLLNKLKANEKMPQGTNATGEKQYAAGTVPKATANDSQQQPQQQPQQQQGVGGAIGATSNVIAKGGNVIKNVLGAGNQPLTGIPGAMSKGVAAAGNLIKKALIGGGGQQQAAAPVQQQATAPTQTAPTQTAPTQTAPTRQVAAPTKKQTAPVQQTASNDKGYVKNPGGVDEYFKDEAEEVKIEENRNIAKFVKCLSEKNYSQAHNYLKKIVDSKLQKNLNKAVNKI